MRGQREGPLRNINTNIKKPELVQERRMQIMEAAMELFRKNGYHATTMREICRKAKINMGSFYDYFGSKEDILVYLYKEMMYGGKIFERAFAGRNVSGWNDLQPFLRSMMLAAWNKYKHSIQLLYRETISLDRKTMREVLSIESDYVRFVAEKLRKGLGLSSVNKELEVLANFIMYINSFIPLRGWNLHHIPQTKILDLIVGMIMMKLEELRKHPETSGSLSASKELQKREGGPK
jgi:AcrR family transcriptional regulator